MRGRQSSPFPIAFALAWLGGWLVIPGLFGLTTVTRVEAEDFPQPLTAESHDTAAAVEDSPKRNRLEAALQSLDHDPHGALIQAMRDAELTGGAAMPYAMSAIFADDRFARLCVELDHMPAKEAGVVVLELYERQLERHIEHWRKVAPLYRSTKSQISDVVGERRFQVLGTSVVLCALFAPPWEALPLVKRWNTDLRAEFTEQGFEPDENPVMKVVLTRSLLPDRRFELNVYTILAERHASWLMTAKTEQGGRLIPRFEGRPIRGWDDDTTGRRVVNTLPWIADNFHSAPNHVPDERVEELYRRLFEAFKAQ
jgi:hypothetical protein